MYYAVPIDQGEQVFPADHCYALPPACLVPLMMLPEACFYPPSFYKGILHS